MMMTPYLSELLNTELGQTIAISVYVFAFISLGYLTTMKKD